jgi:hypothetical protein
VARAPFVQKASPARAALKTNDFPVALGHMRSKSGNFHAINVRLTLYPRVRQNQSRSASVLQGSQALLIVILGVSFAQTHSNRCVAPRLAHRAHQTQKPLNLAAPTSSSASAYLDTTTVT